MSLFRRTPHTLCGPIKGFIRPQWLHFGTHLTRFVARLGAPSKVSEAQPAWRRRPMWAHPSHASWPHSELHLRSQRRSPHGAAAPFGHTPHTLRSAIVSST
eukprot:9502966-Pyramimonas_sp.AAC.1